MKSNKFIYLFYLLLLIISCKEDICISGLEVANKQVLSEESTQFLPYQNTEKIVFTDSLDNLIEFNFISFKRFEDKRFVGELDCGEDREPSQKFYRREVITYTYTSLNFDTIVFKLTPHIWNPLSNSNELISDEFISTSDFMTCEIKFNACADENFFVSYQVYRHFDDEVLQSPIGGSSFSRFGITHSNIIYDYPFDEKAYFTYELGLVGFNSCGINYIRIER